MKSIGKDSDAGKGVHAYLYKSLTSNKRYQVRGTEASRQMRLFRRKKIDEREDEPVLYMEYVGEGIDESDEENLMDLDLL